MAKRMILPLILITYYIIRNTFKRLEIINASLANYPSADPIAFQEWKNAELKKNNTLMFLSLYPLLIVLLLIFDFFYPNVIPPLDNDTSQTVVSFLFMPWCIAAIIAAIRGSKAKKLGQDVGINLSK